jgi:hypothetical protein
MHNVQRLLSHACCPGAPASVETQRLHCPTLALPESTALEPQSGNLCESGSTERLILLQHGHKWSPLLERCCEAPVCGAAEPLQQAVSASVILLKQRRRPLHSAGVRRRLQQHIGRLL